MCFMTFFHTSYLLSSIMCLLFKQMQRNERMCVVLHKVSKTISPSGNRTPVSRVTGGDTYHYTNEDLLTAAVFYAILCAGHVMEWNGRRFFHIPYQQFFSIPSSIPYLKISSIFHSIQKISSIFHSIQTKH